MGYRTVLKRRYSRDVYAAWVAAGQHRGTARALPRARLRLTWQSVRTPPDRDNVIASCKTLIDALRCQQPADGAGRWWLGLIANDDPACLVAVEADAVKLRPDERAREGVLVEIMAEGEDTPMHDHQAGETD